MKNNLTIQIIFEYFMDIYNKLFPYSNIHPTFVLYVLLSKQTDMQTHTFQIKNLKMKNEIMNHSLQ